MEEKNKDKEKSGENIPGLDEQPEEMEMNTFGIKKEMEKYKIKREVHSDGSGHSDDDVVSLKCFKLYNLL